MKRWFLAVNAVVALGGSASAYSGNEWISNCSLKSSNSPVACEMYVRGLAGGLTLAAPAFFCIPEGVIAKQLVEVGVRYMSAHAETRHDEAGRLLALAFREVWPCTR
jgi:Rap1a immunity proteins